jgi:hypothetical protein
LLVFGKARSSLSPLKSIGLCWLCMMKVQDISEEFRGKITGAANH